MGHVLKIATQINITILEQIVKLINSLINC